MKRKAVFQAAGAALAGAAALGQVRAALGHDLRPGDPQYRFDEYERIVGRDVAFRMVFQWPNQNNPIIFANVRNGMNGMQFSYGAAPDNFQVVVQAYAGANVAMYDDLIWDKYRWGEALGVTDPETRQPARRNIWRKSAAALPPPEAPLASLGRDHPIFADTSIEGLHRRGVLFLTWHQTVHGHASLAVESGRNPDNLTVQQVIDEMEQHLIPEQLLIPAAVLEVARLQQKGYGLVVNH